MAITLDHTVGALVAENPARARVFEKHRIDYCCAGKVPLEKACSRRLVDPAAVLAELEAIDAAQPPSEETDWTKAPLTELARHIVSAHHNYLRTELPRLSAMTARVAEVHGDRAPEVVEIDKVFTGLRRELEDHMGKEEQILFPWVEQMEKSASKTGPFQASVAQPIQCMEHEHEQAGAALEKLAELTGGYQPPMDACNTWRVLYASLDTFERDMHVHIHKENSILFPRAIELEKGANAPQRASA